MPKKRIQHKGKPKHASEECEGDAFGTWNGSQNAEEEYTTVVDFETSKRYSKRLIESNWSKYEDDPSDINRLTERGDEPPRADDLNYLLEMASSDCAHFEFSSEKLWRNESNSVPASKIFNVDLNVLSSGLACVPFHERMGLDESELSEKDKQKFHEEAENNRKDYDVVREKLVKKSEDDSKMKKVENDLRTLDDTMREKLDLGVSGEENEKNNVGLNKEEKSLKETGLFACKSGDEIDKKKQNLFFSENDENLEDWLDSVLDD